MDLTGKVILITGGAVRLGKVIALEMLTSGAKVFCHYYHSEDAAQKLKNDYPDIELIKGDLKEVANIKSIINQILECAGTIDVLINNAALFIKSPLGNVTEEIWDKLFSINLKAGFFLAQEAGPIMKRKGSGKIINIADTSALKPWPSYIPYALTKSGMISLTKGLAKTLAPEVQVNAINPGPVLLPEHYTEKDRLRAIEKTLLQREGQPKDIAEAVKFLLEDGDYITGSTIVVDGGRSLIN